ncbi:MAG: phosphatase [Bacteroidetes bacterium HGW-Bacteroidetes-15]|nr:MAG: phosphatase [Bacteroidetes bacterium HGW-Bacteroidetes-15]PKP43962.1 MAG: phosphatase [Bacteroidetes bacterium HGW-Bacteroidetes-13]
MYKSSENVQKLFESNGGVFRTSSAKLSEKLKGIKALLFDWDGVFHSGSKSEDQISSFSEADSMGINMLRFAYYLRNQQIPYSAIVTGENNPTAQFFAQREHFDAVFSGAKDKSLVLEKIVAQNKLKPEEILFVFDDILDLSVAKQVGVRMMIHRKAGVLLNNYTQKNQLFDYKTATEGNRHGIREVCELSLGLLDQFDNVIEERMNFTQTYQTYISLRNQKKVSLEESAKF